MKAKPNRRTVIAGGASLAVIGGLAVSGCKSEPLFPGTLGGSDFSRGHRLRDGNLRAVVGKTDGIPLLIAGGGVAGLSAGWRLAEAGFKDFLLYELEDAVGGNARSGHNAVSRYPLGAHYLPVPNREAKALRHMLTGFGVITGEDASGAPVYDPYQLCADLEERLLWRGSWQEGLYPKSGLSVSDKMQRDRFFELMETMKGAIGADGLPAFASPMAYSSKDRVYTALDGQNFASWLTSEAFTSEPLLHHIRYCCRDDYGTEPEQVSAWAGIHYFASRRGWASGRDGDRELTWPEGNGRLIGHMRRMIEPNIRPAHSVFGVRQEDGQIILDHFDHNIEQAGQTRARAGIVAVPHFIASRLTGGKAHGTFSYAPWVVANITVSRPPQGPGSPRAWDNVAATSESLGYVVATHQDTSRAQGPTVLTWYRPFSKEAPEEAREVLLSRTLREWQDIVVDDLLQMNPDLEGAIKRIDVWRWGHAMIRPTTGFLTDPARMQAQAENGPLYFAHSDLSGLSLFEEAHYRGVVAAEAAMRSLGHKFESLL